MSRRQQPQPQWGDPTSRAETWRMLRFLAVIATVIVLLADLAMHGGAPWLP
jgi:hypothetical protein